jgi:hypothetical protein
MVDAATSKLKVVKGANRMVSKRRRRRSPTTPTLSSSAEVGTRLLWVISSTQLLNVTLFEILRGDSAPGLNPATLKNIY